MKDIFFIHIMDSFCHFSCWWFKGIASSFRETIQISQTRVRIDSGTHNKTTVSLCPAVSFCPALRYVGACLNKSSHWRCSVKKGVLRNFSNIHRKTPVPETFFNKVAGLTPVTLFKKRLWHRCFPVNFPKFLGTPYTTG